MGKAKNNYFSGQGIYGSPLPSGLNHLRAPENPEFKTPAIREREGGAIEPWSPPGNQDLVPPTVT